MDPILSFICLDMVSSHESFEDILAIVKSANPACKLSIASLVLEYMGTLLSRELSHILEKLETLRTSATERFYQHRGGYFRLQITKLKDHIVGLVTHERALCDFIMFRAANFENKDWTWEIGSEIPKWPKEPQREPEVQNLFIIPQVSYY